MRATEVSFIISPMGTDYQDQEDLCDEDDYDFLKEGLDFLKFLFEGIEDFSELAERFRGLADEYEAMDAEYVMTQPVDNHYVAFVRKDGRDVYEERENVLHLAKYDG